MQFDYFYSMKKKFAILKFFTLKRILKYSFVALLFSIFSVLISDWVISDFAEEKVFSSLKSISKNRVGILLGTSKFTKKGAVNQYYKTRIDAAERLLKGNKIEILIISGDNSEITYNEPLDMQNDLIERGIPKQQIVLDYAGFRTFDSMERARKVFGQKRITIISQRFHNERAIYLANHFGIDAIGYNAADVTAYGSFLTRVREKFARVKVFIDCWFGTESKFLGSKIKV